MKSPIHILHLEDNLNDAALVRFTLEAASVNCAILRVQNRDEFEAALNRGGIDLILSDSSLPSFSGLSAAEIAHTKWPGIPFIFVTGANRDKPGVDSLKSKAPAYVLKDHLAELAPAICHAMQAAEDSNDLERAEKMIRSERYFSETSLNTLPGIFYLYDQAGNFLRWNRNFERVSGYATEEIARMKPFDFFVGDERDFITRKIDEVFKSGAANAEAHFTAKDGTRTPYYFTGHKILMDGKSCLMGTGIDISERKQLEAQFIESQKMEVIGQLAGGVAHDFNNILAVILGYCNLIASELGPNSPLRKYAEEIRHASERAAGLTRQLLVFSSRQTVRPTVLDLNWVVRDMGNMLLRLIDENIEMTIVPAEQIGRVKADSGYVGQVLMNLVVNARDAMPKGGKLTIATSNVTLDESYTRTHASVIPGAYVMLSVSDTGTGMTEEVKAHLFEAFFTTKSKGKGTGLGLATCQTIVQQSGGHIGVYSEVGKGTTFKVYFPRVQLALDVVAGKVPNGPLPRGTETLLVVEDDPSVKHLAHNVLEALGYKVLSALNGRDALEVVREHKGSPIRLVVTDVIMPRMGGKALVESLKTKNPNLNILFTSGYLDDTITDHGLLDPGVEFLSKPYTPATLARKVREMLDHRIILNPEAEKGNSIANSAAT